MRRLLFIVIAAMGMFEGHSQTLVQTYTDRCTGEVKVFSVEMGGQTVVAYYNKSRVFTYIEFTNGTLQAWLEETYAWYQALSPCSSGNANSQTTQQTTNQATTNATNAANNATSNATNNTGTSGTTGTTGTTGGTGSSSGSGNTGSSGSNSNSNGGGSSSGGSDSSGGNSGSSGGSDSGGSDSGNSGGGDSSGDSGSGGSDDSGGSDSSGDNGGSSDSDNSSGDGDSSDGDSSGGEESDSGGETEENKDDSKNEESKDEKSDEKSEEKSEEKEEEVEEEKKEEKEEEKEEEKKEDKEEEEEEEKKEESKEEEEEEEEEKEKTLAPPIVTANLVTMQMMDGVLQQAASFGYSQSSLTGRETYSANAMVWSNLKQFSLNLSQSTVYFNYDREVPVMVLDPDTGKKYKFGSYMDKGSIMMVQSVSAGYMKMFSTHIVTAGISNVYLGQKENSWKGFVGGFALTSMGVFLEGGEKIATVSITGFATKPFNVKDRLVVSPMLAYSHSPMTYAVKAKTITWTEYGTYIVGSNFDFKLSQRFNANIGGTVIGNTQPGIPMSYAITVGSRFQF